MSKFILKQFDEPLIVFRIEQVDDQPIEAVVEWITTNRQKLPFGLQIKNESLMEWLEHRISMTQRTYRSRIWEAQNIDQNDLIEIYSKCFGLSVTDAYWVVPEEFKGTFADYNLYDNEFSEDIGRVAFTGKIHEIIELGPNPEFSTAGSLPKAWRRINGQLYLYKWGYRSVEGVENRKSFSEYYACQIAQALELDHVEYELDIWENVITSICPNFTSKEVSFVPLSKVIERYTFTNIVEVMESYGCMESFRKMVLFDAIINNTGRTSDDVGFLRENQTGRILRMAPIFDAGCSLFYELDDEEVMSGDVFSQYFVQNSASKMGFEHN